VSIMSQAPDSKPDPTLSGVARLMLGSPDAFTAEVGALLEQVASDHEHPVMCWSCNAVGDGVCATMMQATTVAFAWLLKVVDERG
jgi:hypothetical protein